MSLLEGVIGWLAPADCLGCGVEGAVVCEACLASAILPYGERCYLCGAISAGARTCSRCRPSSPSHVFVSASYEGLAELLVRRYKFSHLRTAADSLSEVMSDTFSDYWRASKTADYVVVPVPTATGRVRERGFDHSALLARRTAIRLGLPYQYLLSRRGQAQQVGAKRQARLKQQAEAYYVPHPEMVYGRKILLIDDVVTTGATLRAATKALRAAGASKVDALVFAKRF